MLTRLIFAILLTVATVVFSDRLMERRSLLPPGFSHGIRRILGNVVLAGILLLGVFGNVAQWGLEVTMDFTQISHLDLFLLHGLMLSSLLAWFLLGWGGGLPFETGSFEGLIRTFIRQFGLRAPKLTQEIAIGLLGGVVVWSVVVVLVMLVVFSLGLLGGQGWLPDGPPEMIVWLVGLPWGLRLLLSLSAGVFEELFFRGFLQPRVGIGLSSGLFILAHLAYGSPFLLVGVSILSLLFAGLVEWRQNIWAAVVAHATFDAIQLLIVLPLVLAHQS